MITNKYLKNETTTVDEETGEVVTTSKTFAVKVARDEFYMSYISNMMGVFNLKSVVDIKLLTRMCMIAEYNTGRVLITSEVRKETGDLLQVSTQQITNSLYSLKKLGLIKGNRGTYFLNPMVYWKGSNDVRDNLLRESGGMRVVMDFKYKNTIEKDFDNNMCITFYELENG
jgi:hypothetical protein